MGHDRARTEHVDVSNPRLYREDGWAPHFARLRREDPVHRHADSPYGPYWSVTRFADIMKVELDHGTYSSASSLGGIQIADQPQGEELPNFIRMDPPRHTAQRRTVAPIVAPTNLANMEGIIRRRTQAVLDGLPRNETFDWVDRVSTELTAMMLATLFDFPWADRRKLTHWSDVAIANIEAEDAVVKSEAERMAELMQMAEIMGGAVEGARRPAAQIRPDLDDGAQRGDAEPAVARVHRHVRSADRGRQRHHAQLDDRRADGDDRASRRGRQGAGRRRPAAAAWCRRPSATRRR